MSTLYPAQIDTYQSLPTVIDNQTPIQASVFNQLRGAIVAVESALGIQPNGLYSSVASRLGNLEGTVGNLQIITLHQDLGGNLANPLVIGIQGRPVSNAQPTLNQVLGWNGIAWAPISIVGTDIIFGQDLSGTSIVQTVIGIQDNPVSNATPTTGQTFIWSGSAWTPGTNFGNQSLFTTGEMVSGPALSTSTTTGLLTVSGKIIANAISTSVPSNPAQGIIYFDSTQNRFLMSENGGTYTPVQPFFNVQSFGAKGDGSTNDYTAITAAIAAAAVKGGIVYFPPTGNYYICNGAVTVPNSVTIEGALSQDHNFTYGSVIYFQGGGSGFFLAASSYDIIIQRLLLVTDASAGPAIGTAASCVASSISLIDLKFILGNPGQPAISFGTYASPAQIEPIVIDHVNISVPVTQYVPMIASYSVNGGTSNMVINNSLLTSGATGTALVGTVTLSASTSVTFSHIQTLKQGQLLQFSAQPSVCYEVATATTASLTATLTFAYFGTPSSTSTTTLVATMLHIESTDANICTNIEIAGTEFEIPLAGAIKFRGVRNSRIVNCWMGDLQPTLPIYPQIWIGKSTAVGSPPAVNIVIETLQADSGVQDAATLYIDAASPVNQSVIVTGGSIPWVQNVPIGGPYQANQGYLPVKYSGSGTGTAGLGGFTGDQPTGDILNTFTRTWAHAEAPETLTLIDGYNHNVTGTGNLRGAYRVAGPTANFYIDGIEIGEWGSQPIDGVELRIYNPLNQTMIIVDASNNLGSSAGNLISTGIGNIAVPGPGTATFEYDLTSQMWILISHSLLTTTINVKNYGAYGDGIHDDTAAIQAALNVFSGIGNLNSGTIYFPVGTYNISSTLTYTGNDGTALRLMGEMASQQEGGVIINWVGAADGYMMQTYGMNQSEFSYLHFEGNSTAFTCLWLHTLNNVGGPISSGNTFHHCYFSQCVGLNPASGYAGTQGNVILGDVDSNFFVGVVMFRDCVFLTSGFGPTGTFACVNQLGGFNTEQFMFENCSFGSQGHTYSYYAAYNPNNVITFRDCGLGVGGVSGACVYLGFGSATLNMTNCICENVGLPSPYTGKGLFLIMAAYNLAYINGGEATMDCSNNTSGAVYSSDGKLTLENVKVDGSGETGSGFLGTILTNAATYASGDSVTVRNCNWTFATQQIPIIDANGNNLTLVGTATSIGTEEAFQIILENNFAQDPIHTINYVLPNYNAGVLQLAGTGLWMNGTIPTGITVYNDLINRSTVTTNAIHITSAALAGIGSTSTTFTGIHNIINRTKVLAVVVDVTTAFSGAGISNLTVEIGDGYNGNAAYIVPSPVLTTTPYGPIGIHTGDLGTALSSTAQHGYYYWAPTGYGVDQPITVTFTSTGANLSAVNAGALTVYITTERLS